MSTDLVVCWHRIPKKGHLADHPCHAGCVLLGVAAPEQDVDEEARWESAEPLVFDDAEMASMSKLYTQAHVDRLQRQIDLDDQLLATRDLLINAFPPCGAHGSGCIAHCIDYLHQLESIIMERWPNRRGLDRPL